MVTTSPQQPLPDEAARLRAMAKSAGERLADPRAASFEDARPEQFRDLAHSTRPAEVHTSVDGRVPLLWWARRPNFGDLLSPWLVGMMTGHRVIFNNKRGAYVAGGAIAARVPRESAVWGVGSHGAESSSTLQVDAQYSAVRGPLTRARLLQAGIDCPAIYGDPALLAPVYFWPKVEQTHEVGVVVRQSEARWLSAEVGSGVRLIDGSRSDVEQVIAEMLSCRRIVSSSLRGLVLADAYHLPSAWLMQDADLAGSRPRGGEFSYYDYMLGVDRVRHPQRLDIAEAPRSAAELTDALEWSAPDRPIDLAPLIRACPFLTERDGDGQLPSSAPAPVRKITLAETDSANYAKVQTDLKSAIFQHLPEELVASDGSSVGAFHLSFFINRPAEALMSHGIADKNYFWRRDPLTDERLSRRFEHLLVPGRWLRDRILASPTLERSPEQVHVVGWPRLDALLEQASEFEARDTPYTERRPRILWAPTHDFKKRGPEQLSTSTYPAFEAHLPALRELFDVEVSVHPRNRTNKQTTSDQLLWADFVVSDFGTMVYEAWALGKPVLFPAWILGDRVARYVKRSAEAHIFEEQIGLHPTSIDELVDMVRSGQRDPDDRVTEFMAAYLEPTTRGRSGAVTAQLLTTLSRGEKP